MKPEIVNSTADWFAINMGPTSITSAVTPRTFIKHPISLKIQEYSKSPLATKPNGTPGTFNSNPY